MSDVVFLRSGSEKYENDRGDMGGVVTENYTDSEMNICYQQMTQISALLLSSTICDMIEITKTQHPQSTESQL